MLTRTPVNDRAANTLRWVRWGDGDYLAARLSLLNGLLVQGSQLANTALEKYLKAIIIYSNKPAPRTHDVTALYEKVLLDVPSDLSLNKEFLALLKKAYTLRYPDDLDDGFNIALNQAKILAQLDRSVLEITKRFIMTKDGKTIAMVLDEAVFKKDDSFLAKNIAVDSSGASALFSMPSFSYDIRIHNGNLFQVAYSTQSVADDGRFDVEGFAPQNDRQFKVAYIPIVEGSG